MKKIAVALSVMLAASLGIAGQVSWAIIPGTLTDTGSNPLAGEAFLFYGTDVAGAIAAIENGTLVPGADVASSGVVSGGGMSLTESTVAVVPEPASGQTLLDSFFVIVFDDLYANGPDNMLVGAVTSMSVSNSDIPATPNVLNTSQSFASSTWQPVPEPGTMALAFAGLSGLIFRLRRRGK